MEGSLLVGMLGRQFSKLEGMLRDSAEDLLALTSFPVSHLSEGLHGPAGRDHHGGGTSQILPA